MADVTAAVARHRRQLQKGRQGAAKAMAQAYAEAWESTRRDLAALQRQIAAARAAGTPATEGWLRSQDRYTVLVRQLEERLAALAPLVGGQTSALVQAAVGSAQQNAVALQVAVGVPTIEATFAGINAAAAVQIVGALERGPLEELVRTQAGQTAEQAARALREGVIRGRSPFRVARALQAAMNVSRSHALTIARTEQLRAYREGSRLAYAASPVVPRWRWMARLNDRTCAMCWAMHGTEHATSQVMATHPNCTCAMAPAVDGVEWGPAGPDAFSQAAEATQRRVLGPTAFEAYRAGALELSQLVHARRSPRWGATRSTRPLSAAIGADRAARFRQAARAAARNP